MIAGGTVIATGRNNAAGIGSGENSSCDSITIGPNVTRVVATCSSRYVQPIDAETVTVAEGLYDYESDDGRTRTISRDPPPWDGNLATL